MGSFLLAVKSSFGFLSTIPVYITEEGFNEFNQRIYLYTFVGFVLGLIIGLFAFIFELMFPSMIGSFLIIVVIYYFTGFNHLDGLADMGDGLTAHGSVEKKISAMKDVSLGIGGAAFCAIAIIALYASILSIKSETAFVTSSSNEAAMIIFASMVVSEIGAKQAMLTIAAFGKPVHDGMGAITIESTTFPRYSAGFIFGASVCIISFWLLGFGIAGLIAFIASVVSALVLLNVSNRHFGGLNGDGIGAANEIGRIVSLVILTLMIKMISGGSEWMLL